MIGGRVKSVSRLALVAAAGVIGGSLAAQAADLGGNCCADLEERVAELEATTVRKGNRVVSLTLSGQVNKALVWHDSDRVDAYRADQVTVRDNDASMSRFRLVGKAKINPDWEAGYALEIGVYEDFGTNTSTNNGTGNNSGAFLIRRNSVYLKSNTFGQVTLGQDSTPGDGAYEVNLAGGVVRTPGACDEEFDMLGGTICGTFISPDNARRQGVYYTSPTFAGFFLSAGLGHKTQDVGATDTDEFWDVALRYAGEFSGFKLAAAVSYRYENDTVNTQDADIYFGSASIMHSATGLFVSGGYGQGEFNEAVRDYTSYWVMAGIEQKFMALGKTTIYGEYGSTEFDNLAGQTRLDGTYYGAGITQAIDAAAADLYLNWRNYDQDDLNAIIGADANVVTAGMRVRF